MYNLGGAASKEETLPYMDDQVLPMWRKIEILFETMLAPNGKTRSLTKLAESAGVALNSISRMKTGRIEDPRFSNVLRIAEFFDISLDYFACRTEEECSYFLEQERRRQRTMPVIATRVRELSSGVMAELENMIKYIDMIQREDDGETTPSDPDA